MLTKLKINYTIVTQFAGVVELVDTEDLKSSGLNSCTGSSPVSGKKSSDRSRPVTTLFNF